MWPTFFFNKHLLHMRPTQILLRSTAQVAIYFLHDVKMTDGKMLLSLGTAREAMASISGTQDAFRVGKWRTPIVIDEAHVAESVGIVLDETLDTHRRRNLAVVLAVGNDKDVQAICLAVRHRIPICEITTDAASGRACSLMDTSDMKDILVAMNVERVEDIDDIRLAFVKVRELAGTTNVCAVCTGTMRIVAEMRSLLVKGNSSEMPTHA